MKRRTIQRDLVLNAVKELHCHATADEVYEYLVKNYSHIGRGTVYRNLQQLSVDGIIRKIEDPDGANRYDHIRDRHYHIKCTECGKFFDLDIPYMKEIETLQSDMRGFVAITHDIIFKGICPDCQGKI